MYRQLPEFGRLAYPVRAEVTKHVLPGRNSSGCPAAVSAAVGTTWGAHKLGGLNIKKYLPPRNTSSARSRFKRIMSGKPTHGRRWGRPMTQPEETGIGTLWDRRGIGSSIQEGFTEITSGRSGGQQGLVDNLQRLLERGKTEVEESPLRLTNESVGAKTEE